MIKRVNTTGPEVLRESFTPFNWQANNLNSSTESLTCHIAPACFWSLVGKVSPHAHSLSFSPSPPPPLPWGCEYAAPAEPEWTAPSPPPGWRSHGTPGGSEAPPWWQPSQRCCLEHDCEGLGTQSALSPSDGSSCSKIQVRLMQQIEFHVKYWIL